MDITTESLIFSSCFYAC